MKTPLWALAALALAARVWAAPPEVALSREGGVFRLQAGFSTAAAPAVVWGVLTDYDGMPRFLKSLRKSRVARRTPRGVVLEQEGSARLLVFSRRVKLTLDVVETPPARLDFTEMGGGEFEEYVGSWSVSASSTPCVVSYQLFAEMKSSLVPRAAARHILEKSVRNQMMEVQAEIERRAAR